MYALYTLKWCAVAPLVAAYVALRPKHRPLLQRFRPNAPSPGASPLWIHACSVGEVGTARPLVEAVRERWPHTPVVVTVSTVTGRALADRTLPALATVMWLPFDHPWLVRGFVRRLRPRLLAIVETELWPALLHETAAAGCPIVLVNGRLSDRHIGRYRTFRSLLSPYLNEIGCAAMQNAEYARRIEDLSLPAERVHVTGNVKFDGAKSELDAARLEALRNEVGIGSGDRVVVFGSTRPGDEALAAQCWERLQRSDPRVRLVIAPRHLDRVREALQNFPEARLRSEATSLGPTGPSQVLIVDTHGELPLFYALADVAVVGGSFYPGVEGHNPIEPAALGVPVVFGRYMGNFGDPSRMLVEAGGAKQVADPDSLPDVLESLLSDGARRRAMGAQARQVVIDNQGAVARTLDLLEAALGA